jgi:hypothetical protein
MASVHRTPYTRSLPIFIAPAKDNSCCSRTNKIALTIFASLAGFFLLPFATALAFSSLVTLAAVAYCPENNPLIMRLESPRDREEKDVKIEVVSSNEEEGKQVERDSMSPNSILKNIFGDDPPLNVDAVD